MIFQLLPVKQAVKYFLIDNQTVEEILHIEKGATKNMQLLDEGYKCMLGIEDGLHLYSIPDNTYPFHTEEMITPFHIFDILTPPPNIA